jgi:hypothetical protein
MRNVYVGLVVAALASAFVPATSQAGLIFHRHRNDCCCDYGCNSCGCNSCGCNSCGYANNACGCNTCGYAYRGCGCGYGGGYVYNSGCGCGSPYAAVQYGTPGYYSGTYIPSGAYNGTTQAGYTPYVNNGAQPMPYGTPSSGSTTPNSGTTPPSGSGSTTPTNPSK